MECLGKWLSRCELALLYLGVLATFAMMCLTSADALSRYLFNSPIIGAYEITEKYLMVAAVFLGLSYAYRGGGLIRVTFLVDRLPGKLKLFADYVAHAVSLGFCLFVLLATTQQAIRALYKTGFFNDVQLSRQGDLVWVAFAPDREFALCPAELLESRCN